MTHEENTVLLKKIIPDGADCLFAGCVTDGTVNADDGTEYRDLPVFYRLRIALHPVKESNIRLEIWLPENWNGRFMATGSGGIGGYIGTGAMLWPVKNGYAAANCDIGTSAGISCGFGNEAVRTDYGWRATHLMAVYGKKIAESFYGRAPVHSYFKGASTGGMQAYSEAQRYPTDFDGIYAEVPSILNTAFHTNYMWAWRHLRFDDGTPVFSPAERAGITALAAAFFRGRGDGEEGDTFVSYPDVSEGTIPAFIEFLKEKAPEFSGEQLRRLQAVYEGPYDEKRHRRIAGGMPIGSERSWDSYCGETCPGVYPFVWAFGPDFDPMTFDFSDGYEFFANEMGRYINAVDPDLSSFAKAGGKLLAMAGTADPVVPYPELNAYCGRVSQALGGADKAMECFRYYLLPGRNHGRGLGADSISPVGAGAYNAFLALVDWVENGNAPYRLDAVSHFYENYEGKKPFVRPVYPYGSADYRK